MNLCSLALCYGKLRTNRKKECYYCIQNTYDCLKIDFRVLEISKTMNDTEKNNIAIQLFEGKKDCIEWGAEQEKYYFAISDLVQILTDIENQRDCIKRCFGVT